MVAGIFACTRAFQKICAIADSGGTVLQGTSKEYIGDDTEEIKKAVKHALQQCCLTLKAHLLKRNALRDQKERKKVLTKVSQGYRGRQSPHPSFVCSSSKTQ